MTSGAYQENFKPVFWLPDGHSQTLWRKFAGAKPVNHRRQRLPLADGDFIDLDWAEPDAHSTAGPASLVLIVHGLCGCSESSYVLALQSELLRQGRASVAMNLRGCSGEINLKARAYHSGVSEDLAEVIKQLNSQHPGIELSIVGYSLGANILLKWLGETGVKSQQWGVRNAVAVSTPFTLALCSQAMLSGVSRIYGRYFTRRLLEAFEQKKQAFRHLGNEQEFEKMARLGAANPVRNIWDFDDKVTAPLHGFEDAADYYQRCSSIHFLANISTRTLLIQSENDPMIPVAALPSRNQLPESVSLELNAKGGHVGFIAGRGRPWLERRIAAFIA